MALVQLGITDLLSKVQKKIEIETNKRCYDHVELDTPSPFYFAEVVQKVPANTKTMFRDKFTVWIHCIAAPSDSSVGVNALIQDLEEAMTTDIEVPSNFWLVQQTNNGLQSIQTDETNEKHAICAFEFVVSYGFRTKV